MEKLRSKTVSCIMVDRHDLQSFIDYLYEDRYLIIEREFVEPGDCVSFWIDETLDCPSDEELALMIRDYESNLLFSILIDLCRRKLIPAGRYLIQC